MVAKTLNMLSSPLYSLTANPSTLLILIGELRESSDDLRCSWLQRDPVLAHHYSEHDEAEHLEGGKTKLKPGGEVDPGEALKAPKVSAVSLD